MGYKLDDTMKVRIIKEVLMMALSNCEHNHQTIIHHSDRGIPYCCPDYSEFATEKGRIVSTTEKYDPYENAVVERINGILKYEFGLIKVISSLNTVNKRLKEAMEIYNNERRQCSLQVRTPNFAHNHQKHAYKSYKKLKKDGIYEDAGQRCKAKNKVHSFFHKRRTEILPKLKRDVWWIKYLKNKS